MPFISFSRLLVIAAFLCACLVPLTRAYADDWEDCLNEDRQWDRAVRGCTAVLNAGNLGKQSKIDAYYFRGYAHQNNGDYDRAIADFDQALKLDPTNELALSDRKESLRLKRISARKAPSTAAPVTSPCPDGYGLSNNNKCLKLAAPTPPQIRRAPPPVRQAPRVNLALELQRELKRIGCYTGGLDGDWGRGSQSALTRFSNQAGLRLGTQPSQNALKEAQRTEAGYCQPVRAAPKRTAPKRKKTTGCRSGTVWLEGQCIPRSQVAEFCGPGFEWRGGSKCVPMSGGGQQAGGGCLNKCESRLKTCQRNVNRSEDEVICLNKFDSCSQSC